VLVESAWERALRHIERQVPAHVFREWFVPIRCKGLEESVVQLEVADRFVADWLEKRYRELVSQALATALSMDGVGVVFAPAAKSASPSPPRGETASQSRIPTPGRQRRPVQLNPKYNFGSFVVGASNQFARAASLAVAEHPGQSYNPLFIYGGVGLGKTHLMNAIGNHVAERADLRIAYVTTEHFTNEVINSIRYDKMADLRKRYRTIDMLLIDDVQFLAGKERTQVEFFHTFNTLYEAQKQIVLSSDRTPKDMPDIEERLRSRMGWGLIADLQPPDVETRIAILRKKSEDEGIRLPEDVIRFLADSLKTNVRDLEGALVRLGAYASLTGQTITLEMASNVLRDLLGPKRKIISMDEIESVVAHKFHVKVSDIRSKRRSKTLVYPRQIAMYLCRELTDSSFPEIGRHFGGKDHTTIMHACKQIAKAKENDTHLQATLQSLREQIGKA
jgi:chromosomal replication initiator protein